MLDQNQKFYISNEIKTIILDMDGVLVDSEPIHEESFRIFLKRYNVSFTDEFIHSLVGHSIDNNIQMINQTYLSDNPLEIEKGVRLRDAIYLELLTNKQLVPMDGIEELVFHCRNQDIRLALASSSIRIQVDTILTVLSQNSPNKINYQRLFEVMVSGDEVKHKKPAPDLYRRALKLLNNSADECLAIEDSEAGILSAKANGLYCIALKNKYQKLEQLKSADYIVDTISEIVRLMKQ